MGSLFGFFGSVEFLCWSESMGAQLSKTAGKAETVAEKPGEAAASPTKTNGQVNDILTSIGGRMWSFSRGAALQSVRNCG